MGKEIERKFLVKGDGWQHLAEGKPFRQAYISIAPERNVRVRVAGEQGYLTIKGKIEGISRLEFEYEIPIDDANELLEKLCQKPYIEKVRRKIDYRGHTWDVDEFLGDNEGLVLAEVELEEESQAFERPSWIGREVTGDPRFYNASLIRNPYKNWHTDMQDD